MIMSPKTRIREMLLSLITCVETFSTDIHGIMQVYCISVAVRVKVSMRVDCVWSSGLWCIVLRMFIDPCREDIMSVFRVTTYKTTQRHKP
jgi:hypothetical protein